MSILRRIQRIASAEIHDLLDHLDPSAERLSRLAQELEKEWSHSMEKAVDVQISLDQIKSEIQVDELQMTALEEQAKAALREEEVEAARSFVRKRMEVSAHLNGLRHEAEQAERTLNKSRRDLIRLRRRLTAIQKKVESVEDPGTTGGIRRAMETIVDRIDGFTGLDEDERLEVDLEIQEATRLREGDAAAPPPATLAERLYKLEVDAEINRLREAMVDPGEDEEAAVSLEGEGSPTNEEPSSGNNSAS